MKWIENLYTYDYWRLEKKDFLGLIDEGFFRVLLCFFNDMRERNDVVSLQVEKNITSNKMFWYWKKKFGP